VVALFLKGKEGLPSKGDEKGRKTRLQKKKNRRISTVFSKKKWRGELNWRSKSKFRKILCWRKKCEKKNFFKKPGMGGYGGKKELEVTVSSSFLKSRIQKNKGPGGLEKGSTRGCYRGICLALTSGRRDIVDGKRRESVIQGKISDEGAQSGWEDVSVGKRDVEKVEEDEVTVRWGQSVQKVSKKRWRGVKTLIGKIFGEISRLLFELNRLKAVATPSISDTSNMLIFFFTFPSINGG